ncbi:expressed unknown protein [Seminavis robusta]|uniref:PARP catalytic domain-containing protein n=1 Tax=Seminavis robusta TaxID=568900 RepID=A0A9N8DBL4_9STRA|nr:expressed unknown protein [Seminavis robusta]|eukprot:Sro20_g014430.1 n/a (371) ;mRNA; f:167409-168521
MRSDDEIPPCRQYQGEAPECVGTCHHLVRSELKDQTPHDICGELRAYCESQALSDFCELHGVQGTSFSRNPHLRRRRWLPQSKLYRHFWAAYHENPDLNIALGFHGTGDANVPKILHYGLDPQYRRTQAFGKGEYFSKEPGLASTYRHEGHCLIVFALLMPKDHEKVYSQKDRDIIVIPELYHQLPLGVIRFASLDEAAIEHSQSMRLSQRALKTAALDAEARVTEVQCKDKMEPLLQQGQYAEAAQTLRQATRCHKLSPEMTDEVVEMLHKYIPDPNARQTWFPRLAAVEEPPKSHKGSSKTLKQLQEDAEQAWRKFWATKMDPRRNILRKLNDPATDLFKGDHIQRDAAPPCQEVQHRAAGTAVLMDQ